MFRLAFLRRLLLENASPRRTLISFAAVVGLVLYASGCETDQLNVDRQSGTAVSPYEAELDAGATSGSSGARGDGGARVPCFEDSDCDDRDACTGSETCVLGFCRAGEHPSCFDGDPCTIDV